MYLVGGSVDRTRGGETLISASIKLADEILLSRLEQVRQFTQGMSLDILLDAIESKSGLGLTVDSRIGSEIAQDKQPHTLTAHDQLQCLALNIYFEARGEGKLGQRAVGHVVMNRVASSRFPTTICAVVHQGGQAKRYRCQFSWWCDGRADIPRNRRSWNRALSVAKEIYNERCKDPTSGALWYHADYVLPYWHKSYVKGAKIGQHIFYLVA